MSTIALRVWLPDRPGALARVASRIGAVGGDVVGIEILERGDGVVVDELVIELPDGVGTDQLARELAEIDQLTIEDIRPTEGPRDTVARALDLARHLVTAVTQRQVLDGLVGYAGREMRAEWAAVVLSGTEQFASVTGPVPPARWVIRFAQGISNRPAGDDRELEGLDTASVQVRSVPGALVLHRARHPLLAGELQQLRLLADIASTCYERLRSAPRDHRGARPARAPNTHR